MVQVQVCHKWFDLSDWAKWVAVDPDGEIFEYTHKPIIINLDVGWYLGNVPFGAKLNRRMIGSVGGQYPQWKHSLMEVVTGDNRFRVKCEEGDSEVVNAETPTPAYTAPQALANAKQHMDDRASQYDAPEGERSMAKTVQIFNIVHGTQLTEAQGWDFMATLKQVRMFQNGFHQDSIEDRAAYVALCGEAQQKEVK